MGNWPYGTNGDYHVHVFFNDLDADGDRYLDARFKHLIGKVEAADGTSNDDGKVDFAEFKVPVLIYMRLT